MSIIPCLTVIGKSANYVWLNFRIICNSNGDAEYIFEKRIELLEKSFSQIKQFRIYKSQIVNDIVEKGFWPKALVFYIKKLGFEPLRIYNQNIYHNILKGKAITPEDVEIILLNNKDYLYRKSGDGKNKNSVSDSILDGGNIQDLKTIFKYSRYQFIREK